MSEYIARDGERFTDADIDRWEAEAESNFAGDGVEVTPMAPRSWEA